MDYLLSDQMMGLKAEDEEGNKISSPSLKLVLSYEHQVRKEMVKKINDGIKVWHHERTSTSRSATS